MAARKKSNRMFMQRAVKPSRKGVFRAKAKRAGMSTEAYARREQHAPGRLGKEARLALTFDKYRPTKRKGTSRRRSRG